MAEAKRLFRYWHDIKLDSFIDIYQIDFDGVLQYEIISRDEDDIKEIYSDGREALIDILGTGETIRDAFKHAITHYYFDEEFQAEIVSAEMAFFKAGNKQYYDDLEKDLMKLDYDYYTTLNQKIEEFFQSL